jgi:hypothetical protein
MKLIISLENCDLSVGYIGTEFQITIQKTVAACQILADSLRSLGQVIATTLSKAFESIAGMVPPLPVSPVVSKRKQKSIDRIAWRAESQKRRAEGMYFK